jgi:hypothetical protein
MRSLRFIRYSDQWVIFHEVIRNTSEGLHEPEGTEKNEHESYHLCITAM